MLRNSEENAVNTAKINGIVTTYTHMSTSGKDAYDNCPVPKKLEYLGTGYYISKTGAESTTIGYFWRLKTSDPTKSKFKRESLKSHSRGIR